MVMPKKRRKVTNYLPNFQTTSRLQFKKSAIPGDVIIKRSFRQWCFNDMNDVLIYGGVIVNVIGAIYLMAYAMKYMYAFHKANNQPVRTDAMKPEWAKKRIIGFGLMILGGVIAIIGCYI